MLEYDDVMNKQREVIYAERDDVLEGKDIARTLASRDWIEEPIADGWSTEFDQRRVTSRDWDRAASLARAEQLFKPIDSVGREVARVIETATSSSSTLAELRSRDRREGSEQSGRSSSAAFERSSMLRVIDARWMEHLLEMDYLREGIGLRGVRAEATR